MFGHVSMTFVSISVFGKCHSGVCPFHRSRQGGEGQVLPVPSDWKVNHPASTAVGVVGG
jgi:hypothetical protein